MAKPMDPLRAAMLLTPTTWPAMFTSGPPELPGIDRGIGLDEVESRARPRSAGRPYG